MRGLLTLIGGAKRASVAVLAGAALSACTSLAPEPPDPAYDRGEPDRVAVVAPTTVPLIQPNESKAGAAAAAVSVQGFGQCAAGASGAGPQGLVFCATLVPIAGLVIAGAAQSHAPPAAVVARAEERLHEAVVALELQRRLRARLAAAAEQSGFAAREVTDTADRAVLRTRGFDTVLQAQIAEIGSETLLNGKVLLRVSAEAVITGTLEQRPRFRGRYRYLTQPLAVDQWLRFEGEAIRKALEDASTALGERILDEALRLFPLGEPLPSLADYPVGPLRGSVRFTGLRPIGPPEPAKEPWRSAGRGEPAQPLLRWEAFPREEDRRHDARGALARISDIRYDVRLASAEAARGSESADAVAAAEYRVRRRLEPQTEYLWTVRARFLLDGRERVTPWGHLSGGLACPPSIESSAPVREPNPCSYRFVTGRWLKPVPAEGDR
jgi:hypothetical protein